MLEGLEGDLDALRFDAVLGRLFVSAAGEPAAEDRSLQLPLAGASLWMETPGLEGGVRMLATGLPRDLQFEALFLGGGE
ncbi:hypothetical protein D3C85_1734730 [compost metagenome]